LIVKEEKITLKEFINQFDKDDFIVLLEGKRDVLEADRKKLIALKRLLVSETKRMIFKSDNAKGSDQLFSDWFASLDNKMNSKNLQTSIFSNAGN